MAENFITWISGVFDFVLNPLLGWLLYLPREWTITILSILITLITTLIYKKVTDQELMKTIKEDIKAIQKQMKEFKDDTAKVMELQKKMMEKSMIQMKQSFKPMFVTMLPILILFGWLWAHAAYEPIAPNEDFLTTIALKKGVTGDVTLIAPEEIEILSDATQEIQDGRVSWNLKAVKQGMYTLEYDVEGSSASKEVLITEGMEYVTPLKTVKDDKIASVEIGNEKVRVMGMTWFWYYIIVSVVANMLLRKILKIH